MKNRMYKVMIATVMLSLNTTMSAQYSVKGRKAMYENQWIREADVATFQVLGYGYARDCNNVYLDGRILPYVDPQTFRLKGNTGHGRPGHGYGEEHYDRYMVTKFDVFYNGRKVRDVSASSFKDLGHGYGKDSFNVYYCGEKLKNAMPTSFCVLSDGYSKDSFRVFYYDKELKEASAHSFKVDGKGYAHDAFNTYYYGKKVN